MGKRKSASGGGVISLLVAAFVLYSLVPREIWIGIAIVLALFCLAYLWDKFSKSSKSPPSSTPDTAPTTKPSRTRHAAPAASVGLRIAASQTTHDSVSNFSAPAKAAAEQLPVSVTPVDSRSTVRDFKLPSAPAGFGPARWVPAGETVTIAGVTIGGGLIYVGTSLPTRFGGNDPSLIDPSRPVASSGDYTQRQMQYWPSYSEVTSQARRAYLNWLADGRKDPRADIGFVFLFFYGLEHRAIVGAATDDAAKTDWPAIAAELRRLLSVYARQSDSFRRYASGLLEWVELANHGARLYEKPLPAYQRSTELPVSLKLVLGQLAVDQAPMPLHVALAWVRLEPTIALRTPAVRCPEEFEKLFAQKYSEICGQGLVLPRNRTKLKLLYRPASSGLRDYDELKLSFKDTPDVTVLSGPVKKLQEVVEAATTPLEGFSRMVSKSPEARTSLEALLQLPVTLWPKNAQDRIEQINAKIGEGMVAKSYAELLSALGAQGEFNREKTVSLARSLEAINIGFEPDVLSGARTPKGQDRVVLFHLPASESSSRSEGPYLAAALTLQLASAVASVDGEFGIREMSHLRKTVLTWSHLAPNQTRRLLAHLRLLMQAPASLTVLKKKFEPLDRSVKETVAAFMATVAQSDGEVSPAEIKILQKVYTALGLDAKKVFTDVHAIEATAPGQPAQQPVEVTTEELEVTGFKLDMARIQALQKDTDKVFALLANIFADAEEAATLNPEAQAAVQTQAPANPQDEPDTDDAPVSNDFLGLDEAHSILARKLLTRPEWSREELLDLASDLDLMLDGALEQINEAAFDAHDIPLFEGEDPISLNSEFMEKVEA